MQLRGAGLTGSATLSWHAMSFLRSLSPLRAWRDLRRFLALRKPHEIGFMVISFAVTGTILFALYKDAAIPPTYKRDVLYVESWPLSRTDREIIDRQKADLIAEKKRAAELRARQLKRQAEFKRLDDRLERLGI